MNDTFNLAKLNAREAAVARIIAFISLGEDELQKIQPSIEQLGLNPDDIAEIKQHLSDFENQLAAEDESLSDLLANAAKSTCCS